MTRFKKMLVAGLVAGVTLCSSMGSSLLNIGQSIFSSNKKVGAASYNYANTSDEYLNSYVMTIGKIPTTGELGKTITIPKDVVVADITDTNDERAVQTPAETIVEVKNPYGDVLVADADGSELVTNAGSYKLTPAHVGGYTVQYAVKRAVDENNYVWTLSNIYYIEVVSNKYELEIKANDPILMPSKLDTTISTEKRTVKVDLPIVYDENGKQITAFVLGDESNEKCYVAEYVELNNVWLDDNGSPKTTAAANGVNTYSKYSTYKITEVAKADLLDSENKYYGLQYGLQIEVSVSKTGETLINNKNKLDEGNNKIKLLGITNKTSFVEDSAYYVDCAYNFVAEAGKNVVTYKLVDRNLTKTIPYKYLNKIIEGSSSEYSSANISLYASSVDTLDNTDFSLNTRTKLPKVTAVDKNNNSNTIDAYNYSYKVTYLGTQSDAKNSTSAEDVIFEQDGDDIYVTPLKVGTYKISFNATDFYGNTDANAGKYDYTVSVTDRTKPTLSYVDSYDFDAPNATVLGVDYSYIIPTKYYTSSDKEKSAKWTEITIPALFVEDNSVQFENFTVSRSIKSDKGFIDKNGKVVNDLKFYIQDSSSRTKFSSEYTDVEVNINNIVRFENGTYTNYKIVDNVFKDSSNENLEENSLALRKAKTSQVAKILLDPNLFGEGTYTIEYNVTPTDYASINTKTETFDFEVVYTEDTAEVDDEAPTVEFATKSIANVTKEQKISIDAPVIADNVDVKNGKTLNYYYVVVGNYYVPLEVKNGKLTFNMSDKVPGTTKTIYDAAIEGADKTFKVAAYAYDDFANLATLPTAINMANYIADAKTNYPHIGYGSCMITVKDTDDNVVPYIDARAATFTAVEENANYEQYGDVSVNGIVFYDNTANAKVLVKVFDSKGNSVSYKELGKLADNDYDEQLKVEKLDTPVVKTIGGVNYTYGYKYTYKGIKFTANKAENYTINYNVYDQGNNVVAYAFTLRQAVDKEAPVVSIGTYDDVELGNTSSVLISATDNKVTESNIVYAVDCVGKNQGNRSSWAEVVSMDGKTYVVFTPKAVDTYTLTVTAYDNTNKALANTSTKTYVINAVDTLKPVISLVNADTGIREVHEAEGKDGTTKNSLDKVIDWSKNFPDVQVPLFTIVDQNESTEFAGALGATGTVTITTPSGNAYVADTTGKVNGDNPLNISRKVVNGVECINFVPTERGTYTATYKGTDLNGNTASEEVYTVYVGDTEKPVVEISSDLKNKLNGGFVVGENNSFTVDFRAFVTAPAYTNGASEDVIISDNFGFSQKLKDSDDKVYTDVTVQVVNSNNNTVDYETITDTEGKKYYKFSFDTAGTYTLMVTATDSVGNKGTYTKTFKVTAKEESASNSSKVLGIVLISVSIVVLAGVVIYFVRGTKLLPKKNKKAKKEKTENKD